MYQEPKELEESQTAPQAPEAEIAENRAQQGPGDEPISESVLNDSLEPLDKTQPGQEPDAESAPEPEMNDSAEPLEEARAEATAQQEPEAESAAEPEMNESRLVEEPEPEAVEAAVPEPEAQESGEPSPDQPAWFVVHCYSGYENKVRHNLEQRIETMGMKDKIFDVVIPTQEEIEVKEGKRRTVERHIFPGYVLVNMILGEESWYVVRNTPGVTGFVGMGTTPTPLRQEEVNQIIKRMEAEAPRVKVTFKVGERVRIVDGPFNDFRGTVAEIDAERTKVRVMVSMFGRDTPVELDFLQVERA